MVALGWTEDAAVESDLVGEEEAECGGRLVASRFGESQGSSCHGGQTALRSLELLVLSLLRQLRHISDAAAGGEKVRDLKLHAVVGGQDGYAYRITSLDTLAKFTTCVSQLYCQNMRGTVTTKRDMYYEDVQLYLSQRHLESQIAIITKLIGTSAKNLGLRSSTEGCVYGDLQLIFEDGTLVDCSCNGEGLRVPYNSDTIQFMRSQAKLILVVEKDAVFRRMISDLESCGSRPAKASKYCSASQYANLSVILFTAKGMPDRHSKLFLRLLVDTLHLPVFGLFDCDAFGINIGVNYKFGARSSSNYEDESLTIPEMRWLGVWPSEIKKFFPHSTNESAEKSLSSEFVINSSEVVMPISKREVSLLKNLLSRLEALGETDWSREVREMIDCESKIEIEALYENKGKMFLISQYLRLKLNHGTWI
ncbi:MAG: endodeoxyribonuclease [Marteilia pararefringens]